MRVRAALVGVVGVLVATGVVVLLLLSGGDSSSDSRSAANRDGGLVLFDYDGIHGRC